jgi:hypothetical protein
MSKRSLLLSFKKDPPRNGKKEGSSFFEEKEAKRLFLRSLAGKVRL